METNAGAIVLQVFRPSQLELQFFSEDLPAIRQQFGNHLHDTGVTKHYTVYHPPLTSSLNLCIAPGDKVVVTKLKHSFTGHWEAAEVRVMEKVERQANIYGIVSKIHSNSNQIIQFVNSPKIKQQEKSFWDAVNHRSYMTPGIFSLPCHVTSMNERNQLETGDMVDCEIVSTVKRAVASPYTTHLLTLSTICCTGLFHLPLLNP